MHSFCLSAKRCSCAVRPSHTDWGLITETFPSEPAGTDWTWLFLQSKAPKAHREPGGQEFQKPVQNSQGCRAGWSHPGPLDGSASPRMPQAGCPWGWARVKGGFQVWVIPLDVQEGLCSSQIHFTPRTSRRSHRILFLVPDFK